MSRKKKAMRCVEKMFIKGTPYIMIKEAWNGKRPKKDEMKELLTLPVTKVILKYYSNAEVCNGLLTCSKEMKQLQRDHVLKNNYVDVAYNFLIGGDALIYEGRGWKINAQWYNNDYKKYSGEALLVAFIGDYRNTNPDHLMMESFDELVEYGVKKKHIDIIHEVIEWKD